MTLTKKLILFIVFSTSFANSQNKVPLRQYLEELEANYPYNFSFKDADVEEQVISSFTATSFEASIDYLKNNSLFTFTTLQDNTIALSFKDDLINLCGIITAQGDPLTNTLVVSPYQSTTTNSEGLFNLSVLNGDDILLISHIGKEAQTFTAERFSVTPCTSIRLDDKIETLAAITLRNYFAKGISKNDNGSLTVNYDEFNILPGLIEPDVLLTIQALPGIQSVNETVSFLNIRGGTNDQNLILWDGIKMYQNGHFFGLISAFNPFLTEKVTLSKNGTSSAIGDGVSGVIAMESSSKVNNDFSAGVGANLISTDAFLDIPIGTIGSIQVSGRKSINNLVKTPTYNSYFEKVFQNTEITTAGGDILPTSDDDFSFFDTSLRALFTPTEKDTFRFNFIILANQLEFLENARVDNEFQSLRSNLVQDNVSGGFNYQRTWSSDFTTDFQFYGTAYELQAANQDVVNNQQLFQENDVLESGAKVQGTYRFSEKLNGMLGYQFNETGITNFEQINNPFFERSDKQVLRTNSVFTQFNYQPTSNSVLHAGLRVNHINKFNEVTVEPRLSASHRFFENFTIEVLGELKSQTTSQIIDFQNDFLGVENRRWVLSRPDDIPIIKSKQLSAGFSFSKKGWLISAEPYLKEVDGITSQSQGFQNQFTNKRTHGSYSTRGIDFLLNKRFTTINTWLSYSYAKNDYRFESFSPQEFPNNIDIRHTLTYGMNYSLNNFNISGGFNWHTGKPTTLLVPGSEIVDNDLNFGAPNTENIKDYLRVDISGTYNFSIGKKAKGFIGISIWNLLDNDNVVNHFFRLNNSNEIEEIDEFALGFTPNFSLRVRY